MRRKSAFELQQDLKESKLTEGPRVTPDSKSITESSGINSDILGDDVLQNDNFIETNKTLRHTQHDTDFISSEVSVNDVDKTENNTHVSTTDSSISTVSMSHSVIQEQGNLTFIPEHDEHTFTPEEDNLVSTESPRVNEESGKLHNEFQQQFTSNIDIFTDQHNTGGDEECVDIRAYKLNGSSETGETDQFQSKDYNKHSPGESNPETSCQDFDVTDGAWHDYKTCSDVNMTATLSQKFERTGTFQCISDNFDIANIDTSFNHLNSVDHDIKNDKSCNDDTDFVQTHSSSNYEEQIPFGPLNLCDFPQLEPLVNKELQKKSSMNGELVHTEIDTEMMTDLVQSPHDTRHEQLIHFGPANKYPEYPQYGGDLEGSSHKHHYSDHANGSFQMSDTINSAEEMTSTLPKPMELNFPLSAEDLPVYGPLNIFDELPQYGPDNRTEEPTQRDLGDIQEELEPFGPDNIFDPVYRKETTVSSNLGTDYGDRPELRPVNKYDTMMSFGSTESMLQYGPLNKSSLESKKVLSAYEIHRHLEPCCSQPSNYGNVLLNDSVTTTSAVSKGEDPIHQSPGDESHGETPIQYGPYNYNEPEPWYHTVKQRDPVIGGGGDSTLDEVRKACLRGAETSTTNADVVYYGPPNINETLGSFGYDSSGNLELDNMNCALPFENVNFKSPSKTDIYPEHTYSENTLNYITAGKEECGNTCTFSDTVNYYNNNRSELNDESIVVINNENDPVNNVHNEEIVSNNIVCNGTTVFNKDDLRHLNGQINPELQNGKISTNTSDTTSAILLGECKKDLSAYEFHRNLEPSCTQPSISSYHQHKPDGTDIEHNDTVLSSSDVIESVTHIPSNSPVHSRERFVCEICNIRIEGITAMQQHLQKHAKLKPFICPHCNATFTTKASMGHHVSLCKVLKPSVTSQENQIDTDISSSGRLPFSCNICKEKFSHKSLMKKHMVSHVEQKLYECGICQKLFRHHGTLQSHLRTHTGEKPFKCEYCDKCFLQNSQLMVHVRSSHTGEKPFVCSLCNKGFSDKSHLHRHMFAHSGEKPFACQVCSKAFSQRYQLKRHMQTHSKEKQDVCSVCNKAFSTKASLKRHMNTHGTP